jgi:hypothetical protein
LIHAFADSFAHTSDITWSLALGGAAPLNAEIYSEFSEAAYGYPIGHFPTTDADNIALRPGLYQDYVSQLYAALEIPGSADQAQAEAVFRAADNVPGDHDAANSFFGDLFPNARGYRPERSGMAILGDLYLPHASDVDNLFRRIQSNCLCSGNP